MAIAQPTTPLDVFSHTRLPRWARFRQTLDDASIASIPEAVAREFARPEIAGTISPGARVVLTAGSRGIDRIAEVLKATVAEVRKAGGEPFVIPAMGSHGGATAEGQRALIEHYGVTEEFLGCPIRASMETVQLGTLEDGVPVWFDRIAHDEADVVIPVGRVKPHTDFRGPVESGLAKMIAIGLGKQHGANWFHSQGMDTFGELLPRVASFSLTKVNIPFALALVEDGHCKLTTIEAVPKEGMFEREAVLLENAKARLARLPQVPALDVLVVDLIGKDISGDGADPNVINRDCFGAIDYRDALPRIQRCIVRDLTQDTDGNACGIGMFDFTLRRLVDKIDPIPTYMNTVTSKSPSGARIPITVDTDRQALQLAIASGLKIDENDLKVMRIRSTKDLTEFWASDALGEALLAIDGVEQVSDFEEIAFGPDGLFAS